MHSWISQVSISYNNYLLEGNLHSQRNDWFIYFFSHEQLNAVVTPLMSVSPENKIRKLMNIGTKEKYNQTSTNMMLQSELFEINDSTTS